MTPSYGPGLPTLAALVLSAVLTVWLGIGGPLVDAVVKASPSEWLGFAGNLAGGAATLVAALVAWQAVQLQLRREHEGREREERAAVEAVKIMLQSPVEALGLVRALMHAINQLPVTLQPGLKKGVDESSSIARALIAAMSIREMAGSLNPDDRRLVFLIDAGMHTWLVLNTHSENDQSITWDIQLDPLNALANIIVDFDEELGADYRRQFVRIGPLAESIGALLRIGADN
jgi:hypothetical protein